MNVICRKNEWQNGKKKSKLSILVNKLCGEHGVFSTLVNHVNLSAKCLKN